MSEAVKEQMVNKMKAFTMISLQVDKFTVVAFFCEKYLSRRYQRRISVVL